MATDYFLIIDRTNMNSTDNETSSEIWIDSNWLIPCLFVLLIMGTIGNIFGILLFFNSSMRNYSCSLYFLLMAIFDELTLIFWIINRLTDLLTPIQLRNRSTFLCKLFVVVYYSSAQSSIGMFVLATFDRLYTTFKIAHGHFDVRLLTRRKQFQHLCIGVFFLIMIGINAILFGSQLVTAPDADEQFCLIINFSINRIYSIIDLCIYAFIPCICMLTCDILILYYMQKTRSRILLTNDLNKRRERQLSIMLVITSIISLIIVSPYSFFNLLNNFSNILEHDYKTLYQLNDIFGLLSTVIHAMHFYLFLIISSTIRQHFKLLLYTFIRNCLRRQNIIRPAFLPARQTPSQPIVHISQRIPYRRTIN